MNYLIYTLLLFTVTTSARAQLYPQPFVDVQHYKFELDVNDSNNIIKGKTTVNIKFTGPAKNWFLHFVNQNDTGVGMKIIAVTQNGSPVAYTHINNKIFFQNNTPVKNGDTKTFVIEYSGIPADGLIISQNMHGHRTFFSDNWPDRIKNWLPANDHPADKASLEFLVTAPDNYEVISNGLLQFEKRIDQNRKLSYWKEDELLPTKIFALGIADFEVEKSGTVSDSIPVYSWVYPENKKEGFYEYGLAPEILNYFIKNIAPFPYKKLANIQSKTIFGGVENAGAIFYNENSTKGDRSNEPLLAHEIAHQWFGDMASEKSFDHLWLSEGFATYLTNLYMENKYGTDTLKSRLAKDRGEVVAFTYSYNAPVVDTTQTDYMNLLNPNSYQKAGWILHMLRRKVGDDNFWKILQAYYKKYAGSNANTDDFRKVAEEVSKQNLKQFFKQWLYTPGVPQLEISYKLNPKTGKVKLTVVQKQKTLYSFPLEITAQYSKSTGQLVMPVSKRTTTMDIPKGSGSFIDLKVDEKVNLLFERVERLEK